MKSTISIETWSEESFEVAVSPDNAHLGRPIFERVIEFPDPGMRQFREMKWNQSLGPLAAKSSLVSSPPETIGVLVLLFSLLFAHGSDRLSDTAQAHRSESAAAVHGRKLFTDGTFEGNGRTCIDCHGPSTGTLSPADAQTRFARGMLSKDGLQNDALFRSLDSDNGVGAQYDRLLTNATIRVKIDLPQNVSLASDSAARSVIVNRGIPSTVNVGLNTVLMQDGRAPDLETQARAAILGHAQATQLPAATELNEIAQYERTLFSRPELAGYFQGGPRPELPQGTTPEEIRGRKTFEQSCVFCHGGPMLNQTLDGRNFENIFVSERNLLGNPLQTFIFTSADGTTNHVETPDPGLGLVRGDASLVNQFRIPTLWNVKHTAPYFHDNSAKSLEQLMEHYQLYLPLTDQDSRDIIAFLKLL